MFGEIDGTYRLVRATQHGIARMIPAIGSATSRPAVTAVAPGEVLTSLASAGGSVGRFGGHRRQIGGPGGGRGRRAGRSDGPLPTSTGACPEKTVLLASMTGTLSKCRPDNFMLLSRHTVICWRCFPFGWSGETISRRWRLRIDGVITSRISRSHGRAVFTAKRLYLAAQGRERTLGKVRTPTAFCTPKALDPGRLSHRIQRLRRTDSPVTVVLPQGALRDPGL